MCPIPRQWDYLIVTASNEQQAAVYQNQLDLRQRLGLLSDVKQAMVIADLDGKRIGSSGSTIYCLIELLNRELEDATHNIEDTRLWQETLAQLRVLIIHGGGDSRRLPAYGPCGKVFVPVPGEGDIAFGETLFDRQLPTYLGLPAPASRKRGQAPPSRTGQVVITSGDVLLSFDPSKVDFTSEGITGLGCRTVPEQASKHGVYCADSHGRVRLFLQKPTPNEQAENGAIDRCGQSTLDIGVMSFDAQTSVKFLQMCGTKANAKGKLVWTGDMAKAILRHGLDFYREIACALGNETTKADYVIHTRRSGSKLRDRHLEHIFNALSGTPFSVRVLPHCGFLHFGTAQQIISSGIELSRADLGVSQLDTCLDINNEITPASSCRKTGAGGGSLAGSNCWVEGCRISAPLALGGQNVIVGIDVDQPLSVPPGICIDVLEGRSNSGKTLWFVRWYGVDDTFKNSLEEGIVFCGRNLTDWLSGVGASPDHIWDKDLPRQQRTLWNARLFCAEKGTKDYHRWLGMSNPTNVSKVQKQTWLDADRYSFAEIAELADHAAFHSRRTSIRSSIVGGSLHRMFRNISAFSAGELAHLLRYAKDQSAWVSRLLAEAQSAKADSDDSGDMAESDCFIFSRMMHSLGSAVEQLANNPDEKLSQLLPRLSGALNPSQETWMQHLGLGIDDAITVRDWSAKVKAAAFGHLEWTIIAGPRRPEHPVNTLRRDEIVWGRAPARLDTGGGWTDTPPYSLENGGCVLNAAVDLNGQPPIQAYARIIDEPAIRISSIDLGVRVEISSLNEILDYSQTTGGFALAKAALALCGFSHETTAWPQAPDSSSRGQDADLKQMLELFGGGMELTTIAAIPKGSGLGTSSIMGAVLIAVIQRMMGRTLSQKELFHDVLRLEQALTTGGGWQDQIGGAIGGMKLITTEPGLVPNARIHHLPPDVLDPQANGGQTLLYYTGITRLAKDILRQVVGRYLDRDRLTVATLKRIGTVAQEAADAISRKDIRAYGLLIDQAWELNKQLDPNSTNDQVDAIFARIRPHVYGAKLLGAGGGGFMLMVCKSISDAATVRKMLENDPPNELARFFDFSVNHEGLVVTVC